MKNVSPRPHQNAGQVARRTAEIEALKNALCVLDEEDKDIPECSGKLFLQK